MATASEISVGVSHELAITGCKVGFEPKDFATLAHSEDKMALILGVLRGTHEVKPIVHAINLGSPAVLPFNGAVLEVHRGEGVVKLERRGDVLYLDGKPLSLFFSHQQKNGGVSGGHDLRKKVEKRGGNVSAKVLDHLVAHPELWPESWKKTKRATPSSSSFGMTSSAFRRAAAFASAVGTGTMTRSSRPAVGLTTVGTATTSLLRSQVSFWSFGFQGRPSKGGPHSFQ